MRHISEHMARGVVASAFKAGFCDAIAYLQENPEYLRSLREQEARMLADQQARFHLMRVGFPAQTDPA